MDTTEKRFESDIEAFLLSEAGGYVKGCRETYDKARAIDMSVMLAFIGKTQTKAWARFCRVYGNDAEAQLYKTFQRNVDEHGLIHVLRNGVKDRGIALRFCYFAPASDLNAELVEKYEANILTERRQFHYSMSNENSIDMVLSLNGVPVVALELKNQLKGQSTADSMRQYREDRDPRELIFNFNKRVLVCFGADLRDVVMTTRLDGARTRFLPFNQGSNGAGNVGDGGNPENPDGYPTAYLWERVLRRENLLALLQHYVSLQTTETLALENGRQVKKASTKLIFPRYHQLDVVEKLVADTRERGAGKNYLIQHSAGSGKSNSIAWLTYRLASLHDASRESVFRTVFVVTDRRVLNAQLRETILSFEHSAGQIETVTDKDNSSKLRDAINDGKRIVITTLHRFPLVYKEIDAHAGKNFAVIVDEAHSSQTGKSAQKLKTALADTESALKEWAELEGKEEAALKDEMDVLSEALLSQGQHANLSFYAFTATPKPKTLEIFGEKRGDGSFDAFHHYSMRQAIDEGFIEDVLRFYTTYETSYEIGKISEDNPEYEEPPATKAIRAYHDGHGFVIDQKAAIMTEKFREITLNRIGGRAKAMIVSPSRAHAVRYFFAIKKYCAERGYADVRPLVAFSGKVKYDGKEWTEPELNSAGTLRISEAQLPLYFGSEMFNLLIVAEKYQTGFDEPLLHTMFVDKKLSGVKAVQTLSRLNRQCPGKIDTYVFDFANSNEDIARAFKPFYEDTFLEKAIDVNDVYTFWAELEKMRLWSREDEDKVYAVYSAAEQSRTALGKISSALVPATSAYNRLSEENRFKARALIKNFCRFYAYVTQIVRTFDAELHKSYIFAEIFYRFLPKSAHEKVVLGDKIALVSNKLTETFSGAITLAPEKAEKTFPPEAPRRKPAKPTRTFDTLKNIIDKINLMYQGDFSEADRVIVEEIFDRLQARQKQLSKLAKASTPEMFAKNLFPAEFNKVANECYNQRMDAFAKLFENEDFYSHVMAEMGAALYADLRNRREGAKRKE